MFTADQASAFEFLRGKLRPRQLAIAKAILQGDIAVAKGLMAFDEANYQPPTDTISAGLGTLLEFLKTCTRPADYSKIELMVSNLQQASKQRLEQHDQEVNEAASSGGKTTGGPPPAPAQDSAPSPFRKLMGDRAGGNAPRDFNTRFPGAARIRNM